MNAQMDEAIVPERLVALLSGLFGGLGAVLAAIGLYGLLAYLVARRVNEIGIRMALGATPNRIAGMVLRDALAMLCSGLLLGSVIAFWSRRLAAGVFSDVVPDNGATVLLSAASMLAIALLAGYIPGRRASRISPTEALRHD